MLQTATLSFLRQLSRNNNKPWFDAHKKDYEQAKADMEQLVDKILQRLAKDEPGYGEQQAKNCIFRIYRDVRFSKDKSPYKSHFGAYFTPSGKKDAGPGYYIHIEPGKSFLAGGMWMPQPHELKAIRQEIDYNFDEFRKIVEHRKFKKLFGDLDTTEKLRTVPKGYQADNPAIEYLKLKSFTAGTKLDDGDLTGKTLEKKIVDVFSAMKDFNDFLKRGLD